MQNFLNTTTHTIAWFLQRHRAEELQLKAPFQRNAVWTPKQKGYLIDSILRGYPIPELYMQEYTDAKGAGQYVVVDGQQRIRACLEFVDGQFSLDPTDSPDLADMTFSDLNDEQKKQVYGYNFVVRVLPEMQESDIRGMFQRLNRNVVALNTQELRHATYWGEFITSMEGLASDERWGLVGVFTPNDIRRMQDAEFISELAVAHLHGLQNKKSSLDEWYQAYEREYPQRVRVEGAFRVTLAETLAILPDIDKTRWRKRSDFYSLFLLLARHADLMPFSREGRSEIRTLLLEFASQVDRYIADPDNAGLPKGIVEYTLAVERAASDLGNRRVRETHIQTLLSTVIAKERKAAAAVALDSPQALGDVT